MEHIQLQKNGNKVFPQVTWDDFVPNADTSFQMIDYNGERPMIGGNNKVAVKSGPVMVSGFQGFAIYDDLCVRMANGQNHSIYKIRSGGMSEVANFTMTAGHSNSLQFSPIVEPGNNYPYLYVSVFDSTCIVLSISASYSVTKVQTITFDVTDFDATANIQIGDDGYIWAAYTDTNSRFHFIKFRKVFVSEGDVTLTDADILDDWRSDNLFPYSSYVWQGMKVKYGKIWFVYGTTGTSQHRGVVIFDTATHREIANFSLDSIGNVEFEDVDFYDNGLLIVCYSADTYIVKF